MSTQEARSLLDAYDQVIRSQEEMAASVERLAGQAQQKAADLKKALYGDRPPEWYTLDAIAPELLEAEDQAERLWDQAEVADLIVMNLRRVRDALARNANQPESLEAAR